MAKIAFVGAGSVVFTKTLICDILQNPALQDSTLSLMDIDPRRLETARILAERVVRQMKVNAKVEASLDLKTALKGAKYAITTIQVGGYKPSTVVDFEIPRKYGLLQTIGDTLGVGGVFRGLRTIPPLINVARTLQEVGAQNPLMLNYSNPMAMNMMGIDRATGIASVGLCHSVQGTSRQIASYAGLDYEKVSYLCAGINHMAFFLKFEYMGQDAYPLIFKALESPAFGSDRVRFEMMRRLGYFVTESSEHQSEYNPYFIHHGKEVIDSFDIPIDEYLRRCESIIATWERTEREMLADTKPIHFRKSVEYGAQIINACETGVPTVIYGNVRNTDLITNLPDACCVEVPCLVDKQGIQPTHIGAIPTQLAAIMRSNINVQELTVEAALTGAREHIYHAVMADPHTATVLTLDKIWAMCDELIEQHQKDGVLGQFQPVQKNTGRSLASLQRVLIDTEIDPSWNGQPDLVNLVAVVTNETETPFNGSVTLSYNTNDYSVSLPSELGLSLAIGEVRKIPFTVTQKSGNGTGFRLFYKTETPVVLAKEFVLPKRLLISSVIGGDSQPLEVRWSGNIMVAGEYRLEPTGIAFKLRVNDTNIKFVKQEFWDASVLEFFFKKPTPQQPYPVQVIVLPDTNAPIVMNAKKETIAEAYVSIDTDAGGYSLALTLPYGVLNVLAGEPFLMEIIVGVNALGDAHGKVRQTWQKSPAPHLDMNHAAMIQPVTQDR
ncbi:MAG: alpha-glucosidase/alpha-galactosidase [Verrucomicrobiota bacterium]|nr:alpha-glucosidase/alpha-galactosidase [Verrucomicrobiota bacterium]